MRYEIEHFSGNAYDIDIIVYTINKDVLMEIAHKLTEKDTYLSSIRCSTFFEII